jgi:hypothetical protein
LEERCLPAGIASIDLFGMEKTEVSLSAECACIGRIFLFGFHCHMRNSVYII